MRFLFGSCVLVSLLLQGCVTSKKYRLEKKETARTEFNWSASGSATERCVLKSVIVFKGPGSWKKEARWDEYLLQVSNDGEQPLRIDSAELIDLLGRPQSPGADPWSLEKLSYTNWDKYGKSGLKLVAGAGLVTIYAGAAVATATTSVLAGSASAGGAVLVLNIVPVVAIIDVTTVAVMNHQNKTKVQEEFQRRRLVLPLELAPGASFSGSLFFPMTPGPQRLLLSGHRAGKPMELVLELTPLAALHLKPQVKISPP